MRIAQSVAGGASEFETKAQRPDYEALSAGNEIVVVPVEERAGSRADVAHVIGRRGASAAAVYGPHDSVRKKVEPGFSCRRATRMR